jgi:hypothetical protein
LDLPKLTEEESEEQEEEREGTPAREPEQQQQRSNNNSNSRNNLRAERPSLSDYSHVAVIGRGAFGEVRLVRELKNGGRLAALKSLDKAEMLRRRQVTHVRAERDALATLRALGGEGRRRRRQRRKKKREENGGASCSSSGGDGDGGSSGGNSEEGSDDASSSSSSSHVVALRASFQDEKRLHLVMEYLPGGDLMTLLMRMDVLPVVSFFLFFFLFSGPRSRVGFFFFVATGKKFEPNFLSLSGLRYPFFFSPSHSKSPRLSNSITKNGKTNEKNRTGPASTPRRRSSLWKQSTLSESSTGT